VLARLRGTDHCTVVEVPVMALCTGHIAVVEVLATLLDGGCRLVLVVLERQLESAAAVDIAPPVQVSVRVCENHVWQDLAKLLER
jgi:hypothetical protein